jgi:hypothetical protein
MYGGGGDKDKKNSVNKDNKNKNIKGGKRTVRP